MYNLFPSFLEKSGLNMMITCVNRHPTRSRYSTVTGKNTKVRKKTC